MDQVKKITQSNGQFAKLVSSDKFAFIQRKITEESTGTCK